MSDENLSLPARVGGWAFLIVLGPLHFAGEMVGPAGGFSWRQWAAAIVGSLLWGAVIVEVAGL